MSEHIHPGDGTIPGASGEPILTPELGCLACAEQMERHGISVDGSLPPRVHPNDPRPVTDVPVEWEPTRWWRVVAPDGSLWCETGDETEARESMRVGDVLWRAYKPVTTYEWRTVTP